MKEMDAINEFKHGIKTWKPDLCSCRPCKVYLQNMGHLQSAKKKKNSYMYTKIHICLGKLEYHNHFFPFVLRCTFTFV